jgi:carboxyl-terminal processing protease
MKEVRLASHWLAGWCGGPTLACRVGTRAGAGSSAGRRRRVETRRGTHEFVRHNGNRLVILGLLLLACGLLGRAQAGRGSTNAPLSSAASAADVASVDQATHDLEPRLQEFVKALTVVTAEAADRATPDKLIYEGAIPSMLRQLDPHTQFFDPMQFDQLKQMQESEQKGFGSVVSVGPGRVTFLQTLPGTPSNRAGIMPGDDLVAINNISIAPLDAQQVIELLTEARQQKVTLFIRRQDSVRILQFTLSPELVDQPSVDRAFLLEPGYGYVRVAAWDVPTAKLLRDAIEKLGGGRLKGLVLDLRDNPGGLVKTAFDGAALFLKPGQRILTAKGRSGEGETAEVSLHATPYTFRLSVVINGKTASASEILAGALQDHDRATIVGEPSYGKGLVQSVMPLSGGSGLALTTAVYYTPSGRSIQKPLRNSALSTTFSPEGVAGTIYKTDSGRPVTGGGGIMPDVRVEPERPTRFEGVLDSSGLMTEFATKYLQAHRPLPDSFEVTPDLLDDLRVDLSVKRIQPNLAEWTAERRWLSNRLKEEIVTQARGVDKGDEIHAQRDPQIREALDALKAPAGKIESATPL